MSIPSFTFLQRDAAKSASEQTFMQAVIATHRIWRNERNQIMFKVAEGDYCLVERKQGLQSILDSGEVLTLKGDVDASAYDVLSIWLTAAKWKLPRLNPHLAYNPPKPAPVAHTPYKAPTLGGTVRR